MTSDLRQQDCHQLFVSFAMGKQGCKVRPSTISGWLSRVIKEAYISSGRPEPQVTGHTTRKMGTSRAWVAGASVEDVCRAATWATSSTFAQFYKLDVMPSTFSSVSSQVLQGKQGSSSEDSP